MTYSDAFFLALLWIGVIAFVTVGIRSIRRMNALHEAARASRDGMPKLRLRSSTDGNRLTVWFEPVPNDPVGDGMGRDPCPTPTADEATRADASEGTDQ